MTWVRLDDGFVRHPRMVAAGLHGRALFIAGLCYCGAHLTNGRIPKAVLPVLAAEAGVKSSTWKKLVEIGSWIDHGDELEVHDYLVYNPSRSKVTADREAGAERQRRSRESRQKTRRESRRDKPGRNGVTSRDPSHPIPSPELSTSSNNTEGLEPPANPDDPVMELLAERRADLEHPAGQGIGNRPAYLATVRASYLNQAGALAALREQHPTWTDEQLADDLDPDLAPRRSTAMTVEETDAHLARIETARANASRMPDDTRKALRR